jgi:hypothetical protein
VHTAFLAVSRVAISTLCLDTEPDDCDPNLARWPNHPLWEIVCTEMNCDLTEMRSEADPNPMKEVQHEEHIDLIFQNLLGSSITLGALHDTNVDGLDCIFGQLAANRRPR